MSTDFERQLRAQMGRVTVRPRPGLVQAAHHRYLSRRRAARAAAVTGTAAVAAAGSVIAVGATGPAGPSPLPAAHTAAYVINHVNSALASTNTIEYSYTILRVASSSAPGERIAYWAYGNYYGSQRTMTYTAAGQPYSDTTSTRSPGQRPTAPAKLTILDVDYTARSATRWHFTIPPLGSKPSGHLPANVHPLCGPQGIPLYTLEGTSAGTAATCMRELLASGTATIAGHQRIRGVDTIKIVLTSRFPLRAPQPEWRQTVWVNPSTYLPVQMTTLPYSSSGSPYMHFPPLAVGSFTESVTEFQWLPPTQANLAQLNAPIPPGFRG